MCVSPCRGGVPPEAGRGECRTLGGLCDAFGFPPPSRHPSGTDPPPLRGTTYAAHSPSGRCRIRFVCARRLFASRRRFRDAKVGREGRRVRVVRSASTRSPASRRRARARFCHWDRVSSTTTLTDPPRTLFPRRSRSRLRMSSGTALLVSASHSNSTRVFTLLACWPPGPPDGEKRQVSSPGGIEKTPPTSR